MQPNNPPAGLLDDAQYHFANFHHPYVCEFDQALDQRRPAGAAVARCQSQTAAASFDAYKPEPRVLQAYPIDEVEFQAGGAYELYNWELFFHIPLLIASA